MKTFIKRGLASRLALTSVVFAFAAGVAQADNNLTEAGSSVSNTFQLSYDVSGVSQPIITNDNVSPPAGAVVQGVPTEFTVDRKIDHSITATNSTVAVPLSGAPGATVTLTFELLNAGNDTQAYSFSLVDLDNGASTFDATSLTMTYYRDADNDGDPSNDAGQGITQTILGTAAGSADFTDDILKGDLVLIEVSATVPAGTADTFRDSITLVAEARDPTAYLNETSATPGAVTTADTGTNDITGTAQNVLADGTGVVGTGADTGDGDGLFAATGIIEVASPDLTADKTVSVINEDGTNCALATATANAKAVPGGCLEYIIEVENTGATATATNLVITDILPAEVTFVDAYLTTTTSTGFADDTNIVATTGPVLTEPTTTAERDCDGSTNCQVTLSDAVLDAGEIGRIVIRATVK